MKSRKILSIILCISVLLGMFSLTAFAEPEVKSADVMLVAQAGGGFFAAPQTVTVTADTAESYGYTDSVDGVSALDALVKSHQMVFGEDFTPQTATTYLTESNGYVNKLYGVETIACGFLLNGGIPNDGTQGDYGYNGTTVETQEIKDGDKVDFYIFGDTSYYSDIYTWIDGNLAALPGSSTEVTVTGAMVLMGSSYGTPDDFKDSAEAAEGVSLAWVDDNGTLTEIESVNTDEDGKAVIQIPSDMEKGTYYLTATGTDDSDCPVIMNPVIFTVTEEITAYVSISKDAAFVQSKDDALFNRLPVTLTGKAEYNIDDLLKAAHEQYADSEHSYASAVGSWGLSVTKLWGDESSAFGYWQNNNSAWSLDDKVSDGDFISAFVYKDTTGWSDAYTKFKNDSVNATENSEITLTLQKYDWSDGFIPCSGAVVSVIGLPDVGGTTNENGNVTLKIPSEGTYTAIAQNADIPIVPASCEITVSAPIAATGITAAESVTVIENETNDITYEVLPSNATDKSVIWKVDDESIATVADGAVTGVKEGSTTVTVKTNDGGFTATCNVTVTKAPEAIGVLHAIAAKYSKSGIASDTNAPWFAADLSAYRTLYPNTENTLSDAQIQEYLDKLIVTADTAESPSDLHKCIIAMCALGYDPTDIVTSDYRKVNVVEKLSALIADKDVRVTNIYTLPYVIIAIKDYADTETLNSLIESALEQKESWQSTVWGTDAAAAMVCALAPFYSTNNNVKSVVDETVDLVKDEQDGNGSIGNAASSGLALAALSSVGIDGEDVKCGEKSLIFGLMTQVSDTKDGFLPVSNSFSTEQGFRGLVAWQLLKQNTGKTIFDFSGNEKKTAMATWGDFCPVTFNVVPEDASVVIEGKEPVYTNRYDLPQGEYQYTVSKNGYVTANGTLTVEDAEENAHTPKAVNVSLVSKPSSGSTNINVTVKILTHDANKCNNLYTYKSNASEYQTLTSGSVSIASGQTVFDALHLFLTEKKIDYIEKTFGYISSIDGIAEFDHGQNSGWLFMVDGKTSQTGCRNVKLTNNANIVWFYTDDYTEESGSEPWKKTSGKSAASLTGDNGEDTGTVITEKQPLFNDVKESDWFYKAVKFVQEKKLMQGTDKGFEPNSKMTRAMLVTVLYRLENPETPDGKSKFTDVAEGDWFYDAVLWADANGIVSGVDNTHFAPNESITREQLAVIIYRYAKFKKYNTDASVSLTQFTDADEISDWALEAIKWANAVKIINGTSETTLSPKDTASRAQIAAILMRFCENIAQ